MSGSSLLEDLGSFQVLNSPGKLAVQPSTLCLNDTVLTEHDNILTTFEDNLDAFFNIPVSSPVHGIPTELTTPSSSDGMLAVRG